MEPFFLIVLIVVLALVVSPFAFFLSRGMAGEAWVSRIAHKYLDESAYTIIDDVTLPTKYGGTTQIDHIIISRYGIFVLETKDYSGWIFADAKNKRWTQVVYREKNTFQNPLHQNYGHICALSDLLNIPKNKLHGMVCFIGCAKFKTEVPQGVFLDGDFVTYIRGSTSVMLSEQAVQRLAGKIESMMLKRCRETDRQHVRNIREQKQKPHMVKQNVVSGAKSMKCSRCGSPMVIRTARKGPNAGNQFLGCSTFPKCRHTLNIK
jgi:hypothetical protein